MRNAAGSVGLVPESYVQLCDSFDASLPPPPPPPAAVVEKDITMADEWGPPTALEVDISDAADQRNSAAYTDADYEVQAALGAPAIPITGESATAT